MVIATSIRRFSAVFFAAVSVAMGVTGRAVADTDGWLVVNEDNDHFFKLSDE